MGRRKNIPIEIKEGLLEQIQQENMTKNFIELVVQKVGVYKNKKQTCEFLARVASSSKIKESNMEDLRHMDFSEDARQLMCNIGCKDVYTDPDAYSLRLYMSWAKFLTRKNLIEDYNILYENDAFVLESKLKNQKLIRLGTDGIPIKYIDKYGYERQKYKSLGSFLIWPRHSGVTINQKKGLSLKDNWELMFEKINSFYKTEDNSFFADSIDREWMNYIGEFDSQKNKVENFLDCYELQGWILDENKILCDECIVKRNEKMWDLICNKAMYK